MTSMTTQTRYIVEAVNWSGPLIRVLGATVSLEAAHTMCAVAMSVAPPHGPHSAFALDAWDGRYVVALERMDDGRIVDHLAER